MVKSDNLNTAGNAPQAAPKASSPVSMLNHVNNKASPLVEPSTVSAGAKTTLLDKANLNGIVSEGLLTALSARAEADKARLMHQSAVSSAIAEYYEVQADIEADTIAGMAARERVEQATSKVSRTVADAILAGAYDRSEARRKMGEAFGFAESDKTGKPTSKPLEPGNTIAKRVSAVTIAVEYAMTGILPDRGGDALPLVGQERLQEELADYFDGTITVRSMSERLEGLIRDARETVPLEMSADKIEKLAGKIRTASSRIAVSPELREAYATLFAVIGSVPFTDAPVMEELETLEAAE